MLVSIAMIVAGLVLIAWGRRAKNDTVSFFKPDPWDRFRARVVQATGCQTVHEALRQGLVSALPGDWLEFDGLTYHPNPEATAAQLAQARLDAAMRSTTCSAAEHVESPVPEFKVGDVVDSKFGYGRADVVEPLDGIHDPHVVCVRYFGDVRPVRAFAATFDLVTPVEARA